MYLTIRAESIQFFPPIAKDNKLIPQNVEDAMEDATGAAFFQLEMREDQSFPLADAPPFNVLLLFISGKKNLLDQKAASD